MVDNEQNEPTEERMAVGVRGELGEPCIGSKPTGSRNRLCAVLKTRKRRRRDRSEEREKESLIDIQNKGARCTMYTIRATC